MGNKKVKLNYLFFCLFLVFIFIYRLIVTTKFLEYSESISATFLILMFILSIMIYGFKKPIRTEFKKQVIKKVLVFIGIYFILIYFFGLITGFLSNSYSLKPMSIINNIFFQIIIISMIELIRSNFINYNKKNKNYIVILTIILVIFETSLNFRMNYFETPLGIFKFFTNIVLPISFKNYMCSYLTYHTDFESALIYSLIMGIYKYVVPIQPNLDSLLIAIINILVPFLIVLTISKFKYNYVETKDDTLNKKYIKKSDVPLIAILIILFLLVFGIGPYKIVGIKTDSMTPNINKGDAVFIEKNVSKEDLKEKDIIMYESETGELIIHRIIQINKDGTYMTKGDYNNTADSKYVNIEQIKGKVKFRIPYLAYPSMIFDR